MKAIRLFYFGTLRRGFDNGNFEYYLITHSEINHCGSVNFLRRNALLEPLSGTD